MCTAIITGATGYIGSHLASFLLKEGWKVHVIVRPNSSLNYIKDISDELEVYIFDGDLDKMIAYFNTVQADVVFHLAAAVLTNYSPSQVPTLIRGNIEFGTQILESMRHSNTSILVSTGTFWQNYNTNSYNPVDLYAATKEAFEKIIEFYVDAYNMKAITLRLYDVYGEDDSRPKLLTLLRENIYSKKILDVSSGEQLLDMVHISDVVLAYYSAYKLLNNLDSPFYKVYGVRSGALISLKNLIKLFIDTTGANISVKMGSRPYRKREVMVPNEQLPILPNWKVSINIKDGLNKFNIRGGDLYFITFSNNIRERA